MCQSNRCSAMVSAIIRIARDFRRAIRPDDAFGALLTLLPGPNLVAYYFAFRLVGHFLSLRGARQGLRGVAWTTASSAPLAELRALAKADRAERRPRVDEVAASLQLEHLTRFFDRVA